MGIKNVLNLPGKINVDEAAEKIRAKENFSRCSAYFSPNYYPEKQCNLKPMWLTVLDYGLKCR